MQQQLVGFLNSGRDIVADDEFDIGKPSTSPAISAQHRNRCNADFFCSDQCPDDVFTLTAGGENHQHISPGTERLHLAGEDIFESVIVTDGGEITAVRDQAYCGIGSPVLVIPADKFSGEMRSIGGTAAVPAGEQFVA